MPNQKKKLYPRPPTQRIFLMPYLVSMVSRVLWHPGISRGARKLARTPSLSKKKKKSDNFIGSLTNQKVGLGRGTIL